MKQIEKDGRLDEWCQDNIDWLRKTYGSDNVVSVVLHMDESTPHLHATVIPIVETERKRKKKEEEVKRTYRKKAPAPRLCADDVMSRAKLKNYQNTYAAAMQRYGLQRGIISKLEKENERLQGEISKRDDQIKKLQSDAEKQKEWHAEDMRYTKLQMQKAINERQRTIDKILRCFPIVGEYLRIESECLMHGFSEEQTDKLVHGETLTFRGYLQADKRSPRVWAESVTAQIIRMAKDKLQLTVEKSPIVQWIQQQLKREHQEQQEQKLSHKQGFHL